MTTHASNPTILYLPLLNDQRPTIRRQACALLLASYGVRGMSMLRRLLSANDLHLRQQARMALQNIGDLTDLAVNPQPFRGIYIECLGRTRLFVDEHEVQIDAWVRKEHGRVGWQKVQGALGYLLHCGRRGTSRATLETAVWGSTAPATVGRTLKTLRQLFIDLRGDTFAAQALIIADQHCLLSPEVYQCDVHSFEQLFEMAGYVEDSEGLDRAEPLYRQAMQLYGGPYMIDMPQGTPWAQARRDHLRGNFLIAAERVAEHAFDQQRYQDCVAVCSQVFDTDESADDLVVWMLRAYQQLGQYGALEHCYRRYLLANGLDEGSLEGQQDPVVCAYDEIRTAQVV